MFYSANVIITTIPHALARHIIDRDACGNQDFYKAFSDLNILPGYKTTVVTIIGVIAFYNLYLNGVTTQVASAKIRDIILETTSILGADIQNWNITGSPDKVEAFKSWLFTDPLTTRHNFQQLIKINERRSARFMVVQGKDKISTTSNIDDVIGKSNFPCATILDANALALTVKAKYSSFVFSVHLE